MPVTIPKRLEKKLSEDSSYKGYIHTLLNNTKPLITEKADFFPEYTLHGWSHIQAVLIHADKLIPDETMEALCGRDVALLIAAVVMHDIGMFLNKAGVRKLLTGSRRTTKIAKLDKRDWAEEWDRYIQEIRRYPEEKLLYHFGISRTIDAPDLEKGEFSDLDLLIVGDFLRRYHHRIAHEIAMDTMPGDTDVDVLQVGMDALGNKAFGSKDRKCIGILARSHGMAIRETREYINRELGRQHVEKLVYLMAVLRLADALDADEQRAPDVRRKLEGIRTPVSVKEWIWNQRISRTDLDWDNSEDYRYIEAEPESTTEFVHLEKWLKWIQSELDVSWAVLSEICDTRRYRLSIHRVESNILEPERRASYGEQFVTQEARLDANPEMLKLLVGPLYSNDPSCGIRELLQNAVDACNERAYLEGKEYRGEVDFYLNTFEGSLTVSDNGIGMDENVLINYFLSAGASYRSSEAWFEQFATDRDPNIVRTGRFGVGVLATFLLGNEIHVITRHINDDHGYVFSFNPEPKSLDIRRPNETPQIGTTIKVMLRYDAMRSLLTDYRNEKKWLNWYRFADPLVRYWVNGKEYVCEKPFVPQENKTYSGWFELDGTEYEVIRWGFPSDGFFCNGIRIPDGYTNHYTYSAYSLLAPSVSIIDKKGIVPLDLPRKELVDFQYGDMLKKEAVRYILAQLLTADWSTKKNISNRLRYGFDPVRTPDLTMCSPYVCRTNEYTIMHLNFFRSEHQLLICYLSNINNQSDFQCMVRKMQPSIPIMVYPLNRKNIPEAPEIFFQPAEEKLLNVIRYAARVRRICIHRELKNDAEILMPGIRSLYLPTDANKNDFQEYLLRINATSVRPFLWQEWDPNICPVITMLEFDSPMYDYHYAERGKKDPLLAFVNTYMNGDPWIPYDMEERRKKFPKAFDELKYYIDRILADREKERGAQNA